MRKTAIFFTFFVISCKILFAVPARPYPVTFTQPNGDTLTIRIKGDERINWRESMDGYTLLFNKAGYLSYAQLDENGNLQPSDMIATNIEERNIVTRSFLNNIEQHLFYSDVQKQVMLKVWEIEDNMPSKSDRAVTGTYKTLCAFVQFQDKSFTLPMSQFEGLMNQLGYTANGTGSVRDFFKEVSYDQFDLEITLCGPYTAPQTSGYYAANDDAKCRELATWVAQQVAAEPGIDFRDYDSNNDNYVDGFHFIFAGRGREAGGGINSIWSHKWSLLSMVIQNGKRISEYSCSPELRNATAITTIGVICHEMMHAFGAADFYDTNYATGGQYEGTGNWDLMASGSWNGPVRDGSRPAHPNMYVKVQFGWVTPVVLNSAVTITNMPNSAENPVAYRINTTTNNEHFLLENRQRVEFDTNIPGDGLLIYRVSSNVGSSCINCTHPQRMYPVCASSTTAIPTSTPSSYGNINSTGCPFPGSSNQTSFTDNTTPAMRSWANVNTNKPITNIQHSNRLISFDFMGGGPIPATLTGTVSISGNAIFGETLIADTSGLTSVPVVALGTLTYQWKRNGVNIGTNSLNYTIAQADIESTITVTVTAANCEGSITSDATAIIVKASQAAPDAPTLANSTTTSITLNAMEGCEYRINGGTWQIATTFTDLSPNTTYLFAARKMETATHFASPASSAQFATDPIPMIDEIIISKTQICLGDDVTLTAIPSENNVGTNPVYTWYKNDVVMADITGPTFMDAPASAATYTYNATVKYESTGYESVLNQAIAKTVTVYEKPVVVPDPAVIIETICKDSPLSMSVITEMDGTPVSATYKWFENGEKLTGVTGNLYTITAAEIGDYVYEVEATVVISGCVSERTLVGIITVTDPVTVEITGPNLICENDANATLYATTTPPDANVTYQWFLDGAPITGATNATYTVSEMPREYPYLFIVQVTTVEGNCARASDIHPVAVIEVLPPVLAISKDKICSGGQVTVSVVGEPDTGYTWYRNGIVLVTDAGRTITDHPTAITNLQTYTYTAILTTNGCSSMESAPVTVTVHPELETEIYGLHEVCEQALEEVILCAIVTNAQPGVTYLYELYYIQGNAPSPVWVGSSDVPCMQIPNTLAPNDPANPYYFFVKVTAVGYGCTVETNAHQLNILAEDIVEIAVDYDVICIESTLTATAHIQSAIPGTYHYFWYVNGTLVPIYTPVIVISDLLVVGTNIISLKVQRIGTMNFCSDMQNIYVNVLDAPTLSLTQNYEGMCVGGQLILGVEVVYSKELTIPYTYTWYRNGTKVYEGPLKYYEDVPDAGDYQYKVTAINENLGCAAEGAYVPVTVVPEITIHIERPGGQYDVCKEVTVEFDVVLHIPNINPMQQISSHCWVWNSIQNCAEDAPNPLIVDGFPSTGTHIFSLEVNFTHPTCNTITSNILTFNVVESPKWGNVSITPHDEIHLGQEIHLQAEVQQDPIIESVLQWQYSIDGGALIDLPVGGNIIHTPQVVGSYTYMLTYIPDKPATGCMLAPF
ncbi:MAG: M6 family metalloprotease domain-containing protein, partial [Lentimicrobiaceae bacterium]|nr:M6 family metalloprotease domain-containing protein [Lentimicrobiaceae bacterium]